MPWDKGPTSHVPSLQRLVCFAHKYKDSMSVKYSRDSIAKDLEKHKRFSEIKNLCHRNIDAY
jgi:hypothetical protein